MRTHVMANSFFISFPWRIPHVSVPQAVLAVADWRNCNHSFWVPQCGIIIGTLSMLPSTPVFKDLSTTGGSAGFMVVLSIKGCVEATDDVGDTFSKSGTSYISHPPWPRAILPNSCTILSHSFSTS